MKRRAALKYTATIMGGSILGGEAFLTGCRPVNSQKDIFSEGDIRLLDEIGETILPESDRSPGAKAVQIGEFMKIIVSDCYEEGDQKIFLSGLGKIQQASEENYSKSFLQLSPEERFRLLSEFDEQARNQINQEHTHFFTMMKQLTIWGYFTSEPGVTKAMRYDPIPGGYDGCVTYKEGDKAWFGPLSSIG